MKLNKTAAGLSNSFHKQIKEIEEIKSHNLYIQKSLVELKNLVEKAKNLEEFKEKDVTFNAYFSSLDQIKLETSNLQSNTETNLKNMQTNIQEANNILAVNIFCL